MLATAFQSADIGLRTGPGVPPRTANDLCASLPDGKTRLLAAKEHIFCEGDLATHVYRVDAGHVCLYRMLPDGRRQVVDFAYPSDLIGLGAIGIHGVSAQATARTRLTTVSVAAVRDAARRDQALGMKLYEAVSLELAASRDLLMSVSHRTASERVAAFLLALSRRNVRRGENAREIVLPMTRTDIADFLGLTIETVSRTFTKFRLEGLIDLEQCILVTIRDVVGLEHATGGGASVRRETELVS